MIWLEKGRPTDPGCERGDEIWQRICARCMNRLCVYVYVVAVGILTEPACGSAEAFDASKSLPFRHVDESSPVELPDLGEEDPAGVGDLGELLQAEVNLELVPLLLEHDERHGGA